MKPWQPPRIRATHYAQNPSETTPTGEDDGSMRSVGNLEASSAQATYAHVQCDAATHSINAQMALSSVPVFALACGADANEVAAICFWSSSDTLAGARTGVC